MKEVALDSWEAFEAELLKLQAERSVWAESGYCGQSNFLYRGQQDAIWALETTLERRFAQQLTLDQYYHLVVAAKPPIETFTKQHWDLPDFQKLIEWATDYDKVHLEPLPGYDYLIYLRHHGFPSPLLDWTASPYVAAFFAFAGATTAKSAAIYAYVKHTGHEKCDSSGSPTIFCPGPYVRSHSRHFLQQTAYTVCASYSKGQWRFCPHQEVLSKADDPHQEVLSKADEMQDLSWKFTIPSEERRKVLKLLDAHNLNAFSLFQTEEALLEMIAMREIDFREREL